MPVPLQLMRGEPTPRIRTSAARTTAPQWLAPPYTPWFTMRVSPAIIEPITEESPSASFGNTCRILHSHAAHAHASSTRRATVGIVCGLRRARPLYPVF
jgi:hypothetical protein